MAVKILTGDCRDVLKTLPDESVHCVVTSPPYWGLRDYGTAQWEGGDPQCSHASAQPSAEHEEAKRRKIEKGYEGHGGWEGRAWRSDGKSECKCGARRIDSQLGLEPSFQDYIETMVGVFREVRRVLRKDGTCWVNMGDSYATGAGSGRSMGGDVFGKSNGVIDAGSYLVNQPNRMPQPGLKPKDLCGIPWRLAFALQADGWWLRSDIIWSKPNPMPESVTDRPTKAHEYLFLLAKSANYYYDCDAIRETTGTEASWEQWTNAAGRKAPSGDLQHGVNSGFGSKPDSFTHPAGRNRRTVWEIATAPFSEAHFATFPPALVEPCIKAGTSEKGCCAKCGAPWVREVHKSGGTIGKSWHDHSDDLVTGQRCDDRRMSDGSYKVVTSGWLPSCRCFDSWSQQIVPCTCLDPFGGAGTTGLVADRLGRNAILIELNLQYADMARKRIENDAGLFYNADKDFGGSIDECYKAIRERKANGGPGWTDEKQQELL